MPAESTPKWCGAVAAAKTEERDKAGDLMGAAAAVALVLSFYPANPTVA